MNPAGVSDYLFVAVFIAFGTAAIAVTLGIAWLVRPRFKPTPDKVMSYECSVPPKGSAWVQFRIIYYLFALLFVIFDVEVLFLFPWGAALKWLKEQGLGILAFVDMLIFLVILTFGWLYAWRKGVLRWT
ncbi:NAD(P)H-quinone oxidoreductase subunit 3 [bacterium HR17]|jgi:NADH-quinone oxidoreductase subunit A|uniref:NADH-quinone oxidoreductase subunit A n=1 Tax=Candidatus Fervidibacter japonicus TaxID=2035412 RepID=A0A2H5XGC0_9BACT|nr:NAD(P)H-quinone oxidoreductase subunit 3 [bacterium HR17]